MAGRHVDATSRPRRRGRTGGRRRRTGLLVTAAVVVLALVVGAAYYLAGRPGSSPAAGSSSACTSGVAVAVVGAPSIAPTLRDIATHWSQSRPDLGGVCPTVTVTSTNSASEQAVLARPDVTVPDLWVPDSSIWLQRLRVQTDGEDSPARSLWTYPAVASSPLVLATGSARATAAVAAAGRRTWAQTLGQPSGIAMTNPATDTAGLLTLLTVQSALDGKSAAPTRGLVSTLVGLSRTAMPSAASGFLALRTTRRRPRPSPAASRRWCPRPATTAGLQAGAIYPSGAALSLDYPVAQFSRPGGDPARRDAATALVAELHSAYARSRFAAAGLRDPAGHPLPGAPQPTGSPAVAPRFGRVRRPSTAGGPAAEAVSLSRPSNDQVSDGLRVWNAARRGNRTLAVIDLSGSMADTAGGESKIRFAASAARAAVDFFPDSSSLGLWGFSVDRAKHRDWSELVSLGPLGSRDRRATSAGPSCCGPPLHCRSRPAATPVSTPRPSRRTSGCARAGTRRWSTPSCC